MDAFATLVALVAVIAYTVHAFRKYADACPMCIWKTIAYAAAGDVLSTIVLRDGTGYGWANETSLVVQRWGALYGNGAVLAVQHAVIIALFFVLAYVCGSSHMRRSIYAFLAFALNVNFCAAIGWNVGRTFGAALGY